MALTQTIKWEVSGAPNLAAYEVLYSDTGIAGPYTTLVTITPVVPGPNYIYGGDDASYFFYVDDFVPYRYYKMRLRDQYGNTAEDTAPNPFQAGNDPVRVPVLQVLALSENTGGTDNLRYITEGGTPIEGAKVRVYKKLNYDLRNLSLVVGITTTNANGRWVDPIFAEPGQTYTIIFHKENVWGPDRVEITV